MATDLTVANLNIKLDMELNRLNAQISTANAKVARMSKNMHSDVAKAAKAMNAALGAIGVGVSIAGVVQFGKAILDLGGKITDLSNQAGIGTDAFQTLSLVAAQSGVTQEQLAQSFVMMRKNIQEAATGAKAQSEALGALNLNAKALQALAPEAQFEMIARRIAEAQDKNAAFNASLDILGAKTAPRLTEVLQRLGVDGFGKLKEEVKGSILSPEQIAIIDKAGDRLTVMKDQLMAMAAKAFVITLEFVEKSGGVVGRMKAFRDDREIDKQAEIDKQVDETLARLGLNKGTKTSVKDSLAAWDARMAESSKAQSDSKAISDYNTAIDSQQRALQMRMKNPRGSDGKAWGASWEKLSESITSNQRGERKASGPFTEMLAAEENSYGELEKMWSEVEFSREDFAKKDSELAQQMDRVWENAADNASSAFADMVMEGEASFDKIASSFARMVIEMAAKWAIMKTMQSVGFLSSGSGMATGGAISSFGFSRVNESGPELLSIGNEDYLMMGSKSGSITPNSQLAMATADGGGDFSVTINAPGADAAQLRAVQAELRNLQRTFASRATAALADAKRRGERI